MKKQYVKPTLYLVSIEDQDIVTASDISVDPEQTGPLDSRRRSSIWDDVE